jgi:hypothetical protein
VGDFGEKRMHLLAMGIAIFGPLINYFLKSYYSSLIPGPYVYWTMMTVLYVGVLWVFVKKEFPWAYLLLARLVVLGVPVEDFFSNIWYSLFTDQPFLPFLNWYGQYFPIFDVIGNPTPILLVPMWYLLALGAYMTLTFIQYDNTILRKLKRPD